MAANTEAANTEAGNTEAGNTEAGNTEAGTPTARGHDAGCCELFARRRVSSPIGPPARSVVRRTKARTRNGRTSVVRPLG
jgi:hypothetical protein